MLCAGNDHLNCPREKSILSDQIRTRIHTVKNNSFAQCFNVSHRTYVEIF